MQTTPINYVELAVVDMQASKKFFKQCFNWQFSDFGEDYTEFNNAGPINGGFYKTDDKHKVATSDQGSMLLVLISDDLIAVQTKIIKCGGKIVKPIFSFPGGKRFHFTEPSGNELAVWSKDEKIMVNG